MLFKTVYHLLLDDNLNYTILAVYMTYLWKISRASKIFNETKKIFSMAIKDNDLQLLKSDDW